MQNAVKSLYVVPLIIQYSIIKHDFCSNFVIPGIRSIAVTVMIVTHYQFAHHNRLFSQMRFPTDVIYTMDLSPNH